MKSKPIFIILITSLLFSIAVIFTPIQSALAEGEESESTENENNQNEIQTENYGEPASGPNIRSEEEEIEVDIETPASVTGEVMNGSGTVVDFSTTGSKAFYTIVDDQQQVFYLIIDMDKPTDNVYFLSEINRSELESDGSNVRNNENTSQPNIEESEQDVASATSSTSSNSDDNNLGFLLTVLLIGGVGAVAYYFLVLKKKKDKNNASHEDDEMSESYEDDFEEDYYEYEDMEVDKQT